MQPIITLPRSARNPASRGASAKSLFISDGTAYAEKFNFPNDAEYIFRLRGWGTNVGGAYPKVTLRVDSRGLHTFNVTAPEGKSGYYEFRTHVTAKESAKVGYAFTNGFTDPVTKKSRSLGVQGIEIEGPLNPQIRADAPARKILTSLPTGTTDKVDAARKVLAAFAHKAFRRPIRPDELTRLVKLYEVAEKQGDPFEDAIKLPLKAVLASPHFLYRVEADPADPAMVRSLSDHELAVRLSYFLWSTMPDAELLALADKGALHKQVCWKAQ